MMPANQHLCPVCSLERIPVWRAMCKECFTIVPWELRADMLAAYRGRALRRVDFEEKVIEARQWYMRVQAHAKEGKEQ